MRPLFRLPTQITKRPLQSSALTTFLASLMAPNPSPSRDFTPIITPLPRSSYDKEELRFKAEDFRRMDEVDDMVFYERPRFVQHIDEGCIERLKGYYRGVIGEARMSGQGGSGQGRRRGARVLDLCSSWTSHLDEALLPRRSTATESTSEERSQGEAMESCVGVGMNASELRANKHLTSVIVRDLNASPNLKEVEDNSIDIAICSVSIDYLTKPVEVLAEVRRVLRDGGTMHCSFSNRCFPTKVVGKWLRMNDAQRRRWVGGYFWRDDDAAEEMGEASRWEGVEEVVLNEGGYEDPLFVVRATKRRKSQAKDLS